MTVVLGTWRITNDAKWRRWCAEICDTKHDGPFLMRAYGYRTRQSHGPRALLVYRRHTIVAWRLVEHLLARCKGAPAPGTPRRQFCEAFIEEGKRP